MPAPSKKGPSEDKKQFSQEDEKEFQQIYQELVDKLKPANAEEEKFYAGIAVQLCLDRKSKLESSSARGRKTRKTPSALKHGAYANTAVLGDEDPKEFKKLHRDLIDEFAPQGTFEDRIVADIARLMWRKQNLATNRLATHRLQQIRSPGEILGRPYNVVSPAAEEATHPSQQKNLGDIATHRSQKRTPEEIGKPYFKPPSGAIADIVTAMEDVMGQMQMESIDNLMRDLTVEERLDGLIDRCLNRLLRVRGLKSLNNTK